MHMQAEHLELYVLGELPEILSTNVDTHLKTCVLCAAQLEHARAVIAQCIQSSGKQSYGGQDTRKSPRVLTEDSGVMKVLQPERSAATGIRILDVSKEGLRLEVPFALMTGAIVQVQMRGLFVMAEVRYCRNVASHFHAGVEIQDIFRRTRFASISVL